MSIIFTAPSNTKSDQLIQTYRLVMFLTGTSTDQDSPPSLQFSWMAILDTGDMMPLGFEISLLVIHCDGTGVSTQHCFLMAS